MAENVNPIKNSDRLYYFEPNLFPGYFLKQKYKCKEDLDNITWNQEDLQYKVNLEVVCPDRYSQNCMTYTTLFSNTDEIKKNGGDVNSKEWVSFFSGQDFGKGNNKDSNFLTDSYTDISFQSVTGTGKPQKEALGIDSIDINFDSHFFPLVTIKFTDVRAAALFGPAEYEYGLESKGEKSKVTTNFFKALFHFPYPRFLLTVMGYYGNKVTFQLAVSDFKSSFNASNGNFDVTVNFIGYMYGLYTDIPMSIIFTSPYYNSGYWDNMLNNTFKFYGGQPLQKFIEYLYSYYHLYAEGNDNYPEIVQEQAKLTEEQNNLTVLHDRFTSIDAEFVNGDSNSTIISYDGTNANTEWKDKDETSKVFAIFIDNEKTLSIDKNKYDKLGEASDKCENIETKKYLDTYNKDRTYQYIKLNNGKIEQLPEEITQLPDDKKGIIFDFINLINSDNQYKDKFKDYYYIYYRVDDIYGQIKNRSTTVQNSINNNRSEVDKKMVGVIESKLKFKPSIENIYRMIFAHIETFINSFEELVNNIGDKFGKQERSAKYLGLNKDNSDIPVEDGEDHDVYPFPLCKDNTGEVRYPGEDDMRKNLKNIDEVKYINKIVEGIKAFNIASQGALTLIESLSQDPQIENMEFKPICYADVFYNGKNPYKNLKDILDNTLQNDEEKAKYIQYFIFARVVMYCVSNNKIMSSDRDSSYYLCQNCGNQAENVNKWENIKDELEEVLKIERGNLEKAGIIINDGIKNGLGTNIKFESNSIFYSRNGETQTEQTDDKYKSNCGYFFKNPFVKTGSEDTREKFTPTFGSDKLPIKLVTSLINPKESLATFPEDSELRPDDASTATTRIRNSWDNNNDILLKNFSYITYKKDKGNPTKNTITGTDSIKELFNKLYTTNDKNVKDSLNAGILQIGDVFETDRPDYKTFEDPYFHRVVVVGQQTSKWVGYDVWDNQGQKKPSYMKKNDVNDFRKAFVLLGCLASYFNFNETGTNTPLNNAYLGFDGDTINTKIFNNSALIIKYPKILYLYFGACYYMRTSTEEKTKISINYDSHDGKVNKNYKIYKENYNTISDETNERGTNPKIEIESTGRVKFYTFHNKDGVFLGTIEGAEPSYILINEGSLKQMMQNFITWVDNDGFKKLNDEIKKDKEIEYTKLEIENGKYIMLPCRGIGGDVNAEAGCTYSDNIIKNLLCEDVFVYRKPSTISIEYSGENVLWDVSTYYYKHKYDNGLCNNSLYQKNGFFIEKLQGVFSDYQTPEDIAEEQAIQQRVTGDADTRELKKALYYSLKRLYDKWLSSYKLFGVQPNPFVLKAPGEDKDDRKKRNTSNSVDPKLNSEFNSFIYVDSFYRDISSKFLINPQLYMEVIRSYTAKEVMKSNTSVFEFMNEIAEKNNLLFASLPVYNNFYDGNTLASIFTPNTNYYIDDKNAACNSKIPGNTYLIMYTGEASSKLDLGKDSQYNDDGLKDISVKSIPEDVKKIFSKNNEDGIDFNVPMFGVTYGMQNQMYFKNITVNMENPKATDYSIANLIQISYAGATGDNLGYNVGVGQDIYAIYANRSYTCTVEMMGCINIMPMMYFQLNNIPMFRGVYIIISVSHSIVPGDMTTRFTGVRVSKNHIGEVKTIFDYNNLIAFAAGQGSNNGSGGGYMMSGGGETPNESSINLEEYKSPTHEYNFYLWRIQLEDDFTMGKLYVNGKFLCHTVEDHDWGWVNGVTSASTIIDKKRQYPSKTAIPRGTYPIKGLQGLSNGGYNVQILNVTGFRGIMVHNGSSAAASAGCVIVGKCVGPGRLSATTVGAGREKDGWHPRNIYSEAIHELLLDAQTHNNTGEITISIDPPPFPATNEINCSSSQSSGGSSGGGQGGDENMTYGHSICNGKLFEIGETIRNNGYEIIIESRYGTDQNFTGKKVTGYKTSTKAYATKNTLTKLLEAVKIADTQGYLLKIWDGYRPVKAGREFVTWAENFNNRWKSQHTDLVNEYCLDVLQPGNILGTYIASNGKGKHASGTALDLTLVNKQNNQELDMGTGFDCFAKKAGQINPRVKNWTVGVGGIQINATHYSNRKKLYDIMTRVGFITIPSEWWHYQIDGNSTYDCDVE